MSDVITPEEEILILKFLKKRKPTRIPPGVSGHSGFKYDPEKKGLVLADPDKDGDGWRNRGAKARGRRISPEVAQRRMRVRDHMKALKSAPQIAEIEGVAVAAIYNDAKKIGLSFADNVSARDAVKIKQKAGKPKKPKRKALGPTPKVRKKSGPPKSEAVAKRRRELSELAKSGTTAPEMAEIYGVSRATIYVDLKEIGVTPPKIKTGPKPQKPRKNAGDKIAMKRQRGIDSSLKAVGDRRRFKKAPVAIGTPSKLAPANAKRTIFESRVFEVADENVLKDGSSNAKIGGDVLVGWLEGARIYTLTLEERATCPSTCFHWKSCYGNAMQFARRWKHGKPLMEKIEAELPELLARHERILIRLHVLGDFWSVEYVDFWKRMLEKHPGLYAFGFTGWKAGTEIGDYVDAVSALHPRRFMIRHSDTTGRMGSFTLDFPTEMKTIGDAIVCPEQLDGMRGHPESRHCGNCGACWSTDRPIAFIIH